MYRTSSADASLLVLFSSLVGDVQEKTPGEFPSVLCQHGRGLTAMPGPVKQGEFCAAQKEAMVHSGWPRAQGAG